MGLGTGLWMVVVFSHFKATVANTGGGPAPNSSPPLLPSPGGVPRPTTLAISTDPRKLPPSLQVVPPATADPRIDLHRSGLISFLFSFLV